MSQFEILFYLSSGLFLGWSLGANDAANVFGTAVASRMVRFSTAAFICSIFVVLGAVFGGGGGAHTLSQLGAVEVLPGAFTLALASALTVMLMTKWGLPVSTSQAIVGAIVGWNLFNHFQTDMMVFSKIVSTWFLCPNLAMAFSFIFYKIYKSFFGKVKIHILDYDYFLRLALILAGAFGSYSLGANNIANVMGVFVPSSPFKDFHFWPVGDISGVEQLFFLGAIFIAIGVYTYSKSVMVTVGEGIYKLNPSGALIVVLSSSLVLFLFSSHELNLTLTSLGLPPIPLVPVSSSQAVVGAVLGISLGKGNFYHIDYKKLLHIGLGWIMTPILSGIIAFVGLFFMRNVFMAPF